jgi:hypothetical protein
VKKLVVLGAGAIAVASAALLHPAVAVSDTGNAAALNVVGEPYAKALAILKSQGTKGTFGGSFGSDVPQSACIVDKQKVATGKMILMLNCTTKAVQDATASTPQQGSAPTAGGGGAPAAGTPGQGSYGGPIGVPVPVG